MRAVKHQHRRARRLVLALMHLQVVVFEVQRKPEPFALNGRRKRRRDIEIERVAKLILLRSAARLDASRHVPRVMTSKTRLAQRPQQIAQRFESQKVEALVGDLELRLLLRLAYLPPHARSLGRIMRLIDRNIVFLLHALDQLLDQLFKFSLHLHLLQTVAHFLIKHLAVKQRLFESAFQFVERLLALRQLVPEIIVEAALQKIVGERAEQIFHAHLAGGVGDVLAVADAFHRKLSAVSYQPPVRTLKPYNEAWRPEIGYVSPLSA